MPLLSQKLAAWIVVFLVALSGMEFDATRQQASAEGRIGPVSDSQWLSAYQYFRSRYSPLRETAVAPLLRCVPDWSFCKTGNEPVCISDKSLQTEVTQAQDWWSNYPWSEVEDLKKRTSDEDFLNMANQFLLLAQSLRDSAMAEDPCSKIAQEGLPGRLRMTLIYLGMDRLDVWYASEITERMTIPVRGDADVQSLLEKRYELQRNLMDAYYFALSHRIAGTCLLEDLADVQNLCRVLLPYDSDVATSTDRYASYTSELRDQINDALSTLRADFPDVSEKEYTQILRSFVGDGNAVKMLRFEDLVSPDLEIIAARQNRLVERSATLISPEDSALSEENALGTLTKYMAVYRGNGTDLR